MTSREYFVAVLNAHISDEMDTVSTQMIERLDAKNAKRKASDSKEKIAARERRNTILAFLSENVGHIFTRDEIADHLSLTVGQVSAACKVLIEEGSVAKSEVKSGKSRKVVYSAVSEDDAQYLDHEVTV